jgi:transcriptional regulator with XRE-family HTH domain
MISSTVGSRIKHARLAAKLTQRQLAKPCGVTRSAISQWETGTVQGIDATALNAAAKALGVSLDWILFGKSDAVPMAKIAEDPPPYVVDPPAGLAANWSRLTAAQQADIAAKVQALADLNASILAELGPR